jgi:hypothetical protein
LLTSTHEAFVARLVWVFVHLISLPQLQNRLRVRTQWFWSYYIGQRRRRKLVNLAPDDSRRTRLDGKSNAAPNCRL